ncbi:alanyl-tRNA editing protein (plasmid) [Pseudorhodobacter turbinis]|uniref:Alanine--tRNA ligase n=1 Tax=Pseudorhodobacter turbinis TaxID=2500533 RepID=A0A4P8ELA0_9RHOB|nr:alanyl-tRNA editing protein [Pseudorhodobacter turbinis]QCO57672.1 alanyl-tRNA editing protein [Pseudorhodobacter turbinis]
MTDHFFRADPYQVEAEGVVIAHTGEGAIVLDRSVFYPNGGGQPGDSGQLVWGAHKLPIATAVKVQGGGVGLLPAIAAEMPAIGTKVRQHLDWGRRYRHMRVHTALHLLSVVIPLPVTGGQVGTEKGRLDFAMPEPLANMQAIEDALNRLIDRDLPVTESWITEAELLANPGLVKTMSVTPPTGQGSIRLVRIGEGAAQVDLQPCGGTHVARTGEIGRIALGKLENKGRQNRRVSLHLAE